MFVRLFVEAESREGGGRVPTSGLVVQSQSPPETDRGTLFKINMSVRAIPPSEPRPY